MSAKQKRVFKIAAIAIGVLMVLFPPCKLRRPERPPGYDPLARRILGRYVDYSRVRYPFFFTVDSRYTLAYGRLLAQIAIAGFILGGAYIATPRVTPKIQDWKAERADKRELERLEREARLRELKKKLEED